jgi:hypothetical protein
MLRYARADLRRSAFISCVVVAGFGIFTGFVVPAAASLLKAIGL